MAKQLMLSLAVSAVLVFGLSAFAAPPGPIDGLDIPTDFGGTGEYQTNKTGWGKSYYQYTCSGSELNRMWVAQGQDGGVDYLYIGITGNLATGGNEVMIFIQNADSNGQNVLKTEFCAGPPYALENLGAQAEVNTAGTPGIPDDDYYERTGNYLGAKFDEGVDAASTFAPTRAISINLYNAVIYASAYRLRENAVPGLTYDYPDTTVVETLPVYATRCYLGRGVVNEGTGDLTEGGAGYPDTECESQGYSLADWRIAIDNRNIVGVNGADLTGDPTTATLGFEIRAPLADLGLTPDQSIKVMALITGGGGGYVSNQSLPSMQAGAPTWNGRWPQINLDDEQNLGWDGDQFAVVSLLANDVGGSAPVFDGVVTDVVYDATTLVATQGTWTGYGDQITADDVELVVQNELDGLWVDNDSHFLYLGITGNTSGGNRLIVFFDTQAGGERALVATNANNGGGAAGGMTGRGHSLPKRTDDTEPLYDFAIEVNESGGNVYVDRRVLQDGAEAGIWHGYSLVNSTDGVLQGGTNPNGMRVAYNIAELDPSVGVPGCADFDTLSEFWTKLPADIAEMADDMTTGFELKIPFADLGIDPSTQDTIDIWAMIVNGGGDWGSDQSLPSLRADSADMKVTVADQTSVDFTRPAFPDANRNYNARSLTYLILLPGDANGDGVVDQ
ncbi:MAG: hypothetical protein JXB13_02605, partial [Phycisphaerae bacterium]|nr:hypothetical protein [Phycisphaerae bacterium]